MRLLRGFGLLRFAKPILLTASLDSATVLDGSAHHQTISNFTWRFAMACACRQTT